MYKSIALATILATASARLYTDKESHQQYLWENFKRDHAKSYDTPEEEVKRFGFFMENLKIADLRNEAELRAGGSAVHGITKFSDLSQAEFQGKFLKADVSMKVNGGEVFEVNANLTTTVTDWTGIYTTPVKNQGYCGSCWAFSATEQIESDAMRTLSSSYILGPEQLVQCAPVAQGCNGGWTEVAYTYVKNAGGIETEADYPYTSYYGKTGTCASNSNLYKIKVSKYYTVSGESNMAAYVQSTGPLSVCLDASSWNSYTGGIMSVCGTSVDHCVQAVGVYPVSAADGGYWKVRNSWGTSWGESGFIRLAYGQNTCDITNDPTHVDVSYA